MRKLLTFPAVLKPDDVVLIADTREQARYSFDGLRSEVATLRVGDYSLKHMTDLVTVERKERGDFISVCAGQRERWEREILAIRQFPYRLVVVECSWDWLELGQWRSSVSVDSVLSSVCSWSKHVPILLAGSRAGGESACRRFLLSVARHAHRRLRAFAQGVGNE